MSARAAALPWKPILVAVAAAVLVAALGAVATDIGPWYYALAKPPWKPPDWLFGPAWTLIFTLTAAAAVLAWTRARSARERRKLIALFAVNGVLNVSWSVFFFGLRRPDLALFEVGFLWVSILLLVVALWRIVRLAGLLLLPYLAWVGFAATVNFAIVRMNPPFGGG